MQSKYFGLFLLSAAFIFADSDPYIALSLTPNYPNKNPGNSPIVTTDSLKNTSQLDIPTLQHIAILENPQYLEGMNLDAYLDQPLTMETINTVQQDIRQFLAQNYPMVIVQLPEQDVSNGTLTIHLSETKAGKICCAGNRWFSDQFFYNRISQKEGAPLVESKLLNDIAWVNRNPFHHTEVVISPGETSGTSDIEYVTKDRFPLRVYTGVDNTGIESTDQIRLYAGANWGNALWRGDMLSYQFTTAPNYNKFNSQFGSYTTFLPWKHLLTIYGGYARIRPTISGFISEGSDAQTSGRYTIPFKPLYTSFLQEFTFGYDYKKYNNDLFFTEIALSVVSHKVDINQFYLGYELHDTTSPQQLTFKLEVIGSPARWLPNQSNADYGALRPGATAKYIYGRMALGDVYTFDSKVVLSWLLRGQLASEPLLPSEQFALGGYDTVRGYDQNVYNADNAVCGNLELHTPIWSMLNKTRDGLFFLGFLDCGYGKNYKTSYPIPSHQSLLGAGLGVRYNIGPYLNARLDYGFQLKSIFDDDRFGKFHFAVIGAF